MGQVSAEARTFHGDVVFLITASVFTFLYPNWTEWPPEPPRLIARSASLASHLRARLSDKDTVISNTTHVPGWCIDEEAVSGNDLEAGCLQRFLRNQLSWLQLHTPVGLSSSLLRWGMSSQMEDSHSSSFHRRQRLDLYSSYHPLRSPTATARGHPSKE